MARRGANGDPEGCREGIGVEGNEVIQRGVQGYRGMHRDMERCREA